MIGQCLCKKITYEIKSPLGEVRLCHCSQCRAATGTAFSANAKIPSQNFEITEGQDLLSVYKPDDRIRRYFCSNCGSPIYVQLTTEPDLVRPRIGGIAGKVDVDITAHVWVGSKADWYDITDDLTQHEEAAP